MTDQCLISFGGLHPSAWSAIIAALALLISYTVARFSIRNKQIDFLLYDHKQFDELQKKRTEILVELKNIASGNSTSACWTSSRLGIEADMFFERFWSLQYDGFVGWWDGYIPTAIYKSWIFSRWRELSKPSDSWTLYERTMYKSLKKIGEDWAFNPDPKSYQTRQLSNFLNLMFDLSQGRTVDIDELLRKYGPPPVLRRVRWLLGAY